MNHSKKLKAKKVKEEKLINKPISSISKPWIVIAAALIVILIGALIFDQVYEPRLMTVDGKKYRMKDLSYYFLNVESSYSSYSQMFGGNIWDMTYDEEAGTTMRDVARTEAIDQSLYNEILYNEAIAAGYALTEDEIKTVDENVNSLLKEQLSKEVIKKNNFTNAYLKEMISKTTLVSRFREDKIKEFNIDEEKIKAGVVYDDFRQYDIEYLRISTKTTNDDGESVDLTEEEKKAAYDKLSGYVDKAKATEDWSTLLGEDETDVTYLDTQFLESDSTFSEEFEKMMMGMNNGEISDIYEDTTGYYLVRMVNNNSSESYDNEVESQITDAENTAFDEEYEKIKANHTYDLNDRAIKGLKMGSLTLAN